jgi:hypothetical protein
MPSRKLNDSPEGLMEMFERHLPYEIDMLRVTYLMLSTPGADLWLTKWIQNAVIESFCVHARNLIEFYKATNLPTEETVAAQHFTKDYRAFPLGVPGQIIGKMNAQITHLSYNREDDPARKIGHEDRKLIMNLLEREMERFASHLREPYKSKWREDLRVGIKLDAVAPAVSTASATNAIQIVTLDTGGKPGPVGPSVTISFPADGPTGPSGS